MALVTEVNAARTFSVDNGTPQAVREFHIHGVDSEQAAIDAMLASGLCPETVTMTYPDTDGKSVQQELPRTRLDVREKLSREEAENNLWEGLVRYSLLETSNSGGSSTWTPAPEIRWQFSAYTESVVQKVAQFPQTNFGAGPDPRGLIGVVERNGTQDVEGAPVLVPTAMLRGAKTYTASAWNDIVARAFEAMCKTNASSFSAAGMTFAPGELLMVGVEARPDSSRNVEVEFQFLYSPGRSGVIDGISYQKAGWEHISPYYRVVHENGGAVQRIQSLVVTPMYDSADYGDFFS